MGIKYKNVVKYSSVRVKILIFNHEKYFFLDSSCISSTLELKHELIAHYIPLAAVISNREEQRLSFPDFLLNSYFNLLVDDVFQTHSAA